MWLVYSILSSCCEWWKSFNNNDRDQVLWARETVHPTQTLVFTKTAGQLDANLDVVIVIWGLPAVRGRITLEGWCIVLTDTASSFSLYCTHSAGRLQGIPVCIRSLSVLGWVVHWDPEKDQFIEVNPLSPNIHIQILQTDLHTFPLRISCENLIKDLAFSLWWSFY